MQLNGLSSLSSASGAGIIPASRETATIDYKGQILQLTPLQRGGWLPVLQGLPGAQAAFSAYKLNSHCQQCLTPDNTSPRLSALQIVPFSTVTCFHRLLLHSQQSCDSALTLGSDSCDDVSVSSQCTIHNYYEKLNY